jgi:hypothetical protein
MPYIHIDLDDFDDNDLIEELRDRGYIVAEKVTGLNHLTGDELSTALDFNRVEHLAVCGQIDAARAEALQLVSNAIGRALQ